MTSHLPRTRHKPGERLEEPALSGPENGVETPLSLSGARRAGAREWNGVRQVPAFWPRFEPVFFSPRKARVVFQNALLPFLFSPALPLGAKVLLSFSSLAFTTPFGAEVFRLPLGAKVCLAFSSFSDSPWGRG